MALPIFQDPNTNLMLLQTKWTAQLNPVLANPTTNLSILSGVSIITGVNVINHLLGQKQQGWIILDINAASTIYRSQPLNDKTLTLTASAPAVITLGVF